MDKQQALLKPAETNEIGDLTNERMKMMMMMMCMCEFGAEGAMCMYVFVYSYLLTSKMYSIRPVVIHFG